MADLTSLLSNFLEDLYAGTIGAQAGVKIHAVDGSMSAPSYSFASETGTGLYRAGANILAFSIGGLNGPAINQNIFRLNASQQLQWSDTGNAVTGTTDLALAREAANTLALKNGSNRQFFRVYGGTSNYGQITSGSGTPEGAVTAGVGTLYLRTDGGAVTTLYIKESGAGNTGWIAK